MSEKANREEYRGDLDEEDDEEELELEPDMSYEEFMAHHLEVNFLLDEEGNPDIFINVGDALTVPQKAHLLVAFMLMIKKGLFSEQVNEAVAQWGEDSGQPEIAHGVINVFEEQMRAIELKTAPKYQPVIKPSEVFRHLQRSS